ncbi:hypothetical protein GCM10023091_16490 [Ravibacter arvi]|uniref:Uncharacterized protein n=1 Tax=Ravibacter arvi TaxID=2051041 RepID=A0ABP8LVX2_9BACT
MQKINPGFQTRFRFFSLPFETYPENKMTFSCKNAPVSLIFMSGGKSRITDPEAEIRGQHQFLKH